MFQADDLDKLYDELGALTEEGDEWFDDDFGLGTPPAYGSKTDKPSKGKFTYAKLNVGVNDHLQKGRPNCLDFSVEKSCVRTSTKPGNFIV